MPIIKSAVKRVRTSEKHRTNNVAIKTVVRKKTKAAITQIDAKSEAKAKTALIEAISQIDKAAKRGVIHKNTAARKKSQLTHKYNEIAKKAYGTDTAAAKPKTTPKAPVKATKTQAKKTAK